MHVASPYHHNLREITLREVNRLLVDQSICFEVTVNEFGTCFVSQVFVNSHKVCKHVGDTISALHFLNGVKVGLCYQLPK